nr:hypothetical protein [Lachnospiraceae bacterium]
MTEWFVSCNPKKYDIMTAFRELGTIDWRQSTNVAAGDIVYIYVSGDIAAVKFKCKANKVDITAPDIDDSKYDLSGEFDGSYGRYMELEMIEELQGSLYGRSEMEKHGFGTPQSPVRVPAEVKEYLDIVQALQHSEEIDPDKHDGCYEFMREIIRSYSCLNDYSQIDYKDLNLVFFSCAGTWRYGFDKKKRDIQESHLPQTEKDRLLSVFESIYNKAQNSFYDNENDKQPSIGMFGVGFRSFLGKADEESSRKFIKMCVEISQMQDDEKAFDRCAEVLTSAFRGMRSAAASVTLHTLRPTVFPILNRNGGHGNIFTYFGLPLRRIANLETYVENCRIIKDFRDNNFNVRNYRVFDLVARDLSLSDSAEDIDMDD